MPLSYTAWKCDGGTPTARNYSTLCEVAASTVLFLGAIRGVGLLSRTLGAQHTTLFSTGSADQSQQTELFRRKALNVPKGVHTVNKTAEKTANSAAEMCKYQTLLVFYLTFKYVDQKPANEPVSAWDRSYFKFVKWMY